MTNGDRIRQMTDEELARLLVHNPWFREESALKWLKKNRGTNKTKWIHRSDCGVTLCPNCGWSIEEAWSSKYCPDCGAKMNI